ncbi:MAG: hypothetical protein AB7S26_42555, partial [Sandaracinaceae bacterium]
GSGSARPVGTSAATAPVMVYHEGDRNQRELDRIRDLLKGREIPFTLLDVSGDEVTKDFVVREAKCAEDALPIVFIAATPVGSFRELVAWDVSGDLLRAVHPTPATA